MKGDRVDSIFRVLGRNSTLRMEALSHIETSETDHCNMVGNPPKSGSTSTLTMEAAGSSETSVLLPDNTAA